MSRDWQCLESHKNRLCKKIRETVENATSITTDVTTPAPSADLRPASDSDLNLTGMVSSKEDTREPVLKSEKNNSLPATTKTGTDKRSTKEEGETVTSTSIALIAIGAATLVFILGAIIYYCWKRSHSDGKKKSYFPSIIARVYFVTFMELVDPLRKLSNLINSYHNHV